MSNYYPAEICLNGHVISSYSTNIEKYCSNCGAKTISSCPSCNTPIRGKYNADNVVILQDYKAPSYCFSCGKPFPWTQSRIDAIAELIEFDNQLSKDEKLYISNNVNELTIDTPKTKVVATKVKFYLSEAATATADAIKDILVEIISESAKKIIFGQ